MDEEYKLTYYNCRGMGESIRLILKLAEVPFEDIRIPHRLPDADKSAAGDNNGDTEPNSGSRFPTSVLPVLEVGNRVLKASEFLGSEVTICRYLARKFKLEGADEYEAAQIERIVEEFYALRFLSVVNVAKGLDATEPYAFGAAAGGILDGLEKTLADNEDSEWYVGQNVSWVDVFAFYVLDLIESISGDEKEEFHNVMDGYPKIKKHLECVYAIPQISAWIASRPAVDEEGEALLLTDFGQ